MSTRARARALLFVPDTPAEDVSRYWSRLQDESYAAFVEMLVRRPRPSRVQTPVLVMGGDSDGLFSVREMDATARAYGGEAVIVPGAGHNLMLDARWREVAERMLTWLRERGVGPDVGGAGSA
ncbi:MAG: alpha/beta hydrolase [Chloroflexi bacterium]|nr:alpha/beta hydrolase [Chloroflexota bacterium]